MIIRKYTWINFILVGLELMGRHILRLDFQSVPIAWIVSYKLTIPDNRK